jgi:beta-galactosidase
VNAWIAMRDKTPWCDAGHEVARTQIPFYPKVYPQAHPPTEHERGPTQEHDHVLFSRSGDHWIAHTPQTTWKIDATSGHLVSFLKNGEEQLHAPLMDNFMRAPLDNDIGVSQADRPDPGSWLARWTQAGLFDLEHSSRRVQFDVPTNTLICEHVWNGAQGVCITSMWTHTVSADGTMQIAIAADLSEETPPVPRIGATTRLATDPDQVTWLGRGPHENYPDRLASADIGWWTRDLEDLFTPYVFPTDCGLRCDTTAVHLASFRVHGEFHFAINRYGQRQLAAARHTHELNPQTNAYLYLDGYHMGVGGDD